MSQSNSYKSAGLSGVYDLVFPLGSAELCTHALRLYGLQREKYFFDKVLGLPISERVRLLVEGFEGAAGLDADALNLGRRLVSRIETSCSVLAVYVMEPQAMAPSDDELKEAASALRRRFAKVSFELMLVTPVRGQFDYEWRSVAEGVAVASADYYPRGRVCDDFSFGYDPRALTALFAGMQLRGGERFELVHEPVPANQGRFSSGGWYRKGNSRIFGDFRLLRFKAKKGVKGSPPLHQRESLLFSLRFRRMAWVVVRQRGPMEFSQIARASDANMVVQAQLAFRRIIQAPLIFLLGLGVRKKKFEHFLLCGYNCELAYRFIMANGFLDSTFFAWTAVWRCEMTLTVLRHFDEIFMNEIAFSDDGDMFLDVPTGLSMHTRDMGEKGVSSLSKARIEEEKSELRSRAAHLREKFLRQLRDDEPTLAVIKLSSCDCPHGDEYAHRLIAQLEAMGGRNFRLLVVCQKEDFKYFPRLHPDYELRTVAYFNPDWKVATEQVGDRLGWMRIWREFAPRRVLAQNKTYKFQKKGHG